MSDPVLCTLAKHHLGDHDERGAPARSACRKVIRYKDAPLDVAAKAMDAVDRDLAHHVDDGEPFDPVAHAAAMAEAKEALRLPHEVAAEHNHEGFEDFTLPPSCPLCVTVIASLAPPEPEPSTQDLIGAVLGALADVDIYREEEVSAGERKAVAKLRHADAVSALAKHVGAGKLVLVGGATFKALAPRKPRGGELAADALWRLEPVEVAK